MPIDPAPSMRTMIGMPAGSLISIAPGTVVSLNLAARKMLATSGREFVLTYNNPSGCIPPGMKDIDLANLQIALDNGWIVVGPIAAKAPPLPGLLEPLYEEMVGRRKVWRLRASARHETQYTRLFRS